MCCKEGQPAFCWFCIRSFTLFLCQYIKHFNLFLIPPAFLVVCKYLKKNQKVFSSTLQLPPAFLPIPSYCDRPGSTCLCTSVHYVVPFLHLHRVWIFFKRRLSFFVGLVCLTFSSHTASSLLSSQMNFFLPVQQESQTRVLKLLFTPRL